MLHSRGGRTPLYMIQQSQGIACTHMPPDQIKRKVLKIVKAKIKQFNITSTFSRDIAVHHCCPQCRHPCADALPYHLAIQKVSIRQGSVVSKKITKKCKKINKMQVNEPIKTNPEPNPFEVA